MRIFSFFILLSIVIQSSGSLVILINFKMHQAYIARVQCEKKDIPQNSCKGNCQLTKKLNEQQETEKQLPPTNLREFVLYHCKSTYLLPDINFHTIAETLFVFHNSIEIAGYLADVFHPPSLLTRV